MAKNDTPQPRERTPSEMLHFLTGGPERVRMREVFEKARQETPVIVVRPNNDG